VSGLRLLRFIVTSLLKRYSLGTPRLCALRG